MARDTGDAGEGIRRGTVEYRRAILGLLATGLATFISIYPTQAILPALVEDLDLTATGAALTVSSTTGALALSIIPLVEVSEKWGRGRVMRLTLALAVLIGLALPFAANPAILIALRTLQGVALAGVPAVTMTWIREEIHARDAPRVMGLYIAGNTVGGILSRLVPSSMLEFGSWRLGLGAATIIAVITGLAAVALLPRQRHHTPREIRLLPELRLIAAQLRHWRLVRFFLISLIGQGVFVSVFNYASFRLMNQLGLSESQVGLVFLLYLFGTYTSARAGFIAERFGRGRTLAAGATGMAIAVALLAPAQLWSIVIGIGLFTGSFFLVHSTSSAWVSVASPHPAQASSMYMFAFYVGSSAVGWATGLLLDAGGWPMFIAGLGVLSGAIVAIAFHILAAERRR